MAFREVDMWEVLQILRLLGRGQSKSAIKRVTGADRKTIRNYEAVAKELGWSVVHGTEGAACRRRSRYRRRAG